MDDLNPDGRGRDSTPPGKGSHEAPLVLGSWSWEEAWIISGRLRSEGIETEVSPAYAGPYYHVVGPHPYEILVRADQYQEARRIVEESAAP